VDGPPGPALPLPPGFLPSLRPEPHRVRNLGRAQGQGGYGRQVQPATGTLLAEPPFLFSGPEGTSPPSKTPREAPLSTLEGSGPRLA
jgi:hypothetical protein